MTGCFRGAFLPSARFSQITSQEEVDLFFEPWLPSLASCSSAQISVLAIIVIMFFRLP
jgi:hypothetical protein